jgi:AcrR family transcriptional regulator
MSTQQFQRARQPEQKQQRRAEILAAAAVLFEERGVEKTSLSAIARKARISKANIYRYFESREEIFLRLLRDDYLEWVGDIEKRLAPLAGSDDPWAVAQQLSESLRERPRLAALVSVTSSVLEHNVSEEVVVRFKTELMPVLVRSVNTLHAALPSLSVESAREFVILFNMAITGLYHVSHPPPVVSRVLQRPEFSNMCVSWEQDLDWVLVVMLRGLLAGEGK